MLETPFEVGILVSPGLDRPGYEKIDGKTQYTRVEDEEQLRKLIMTQLKVAYDENYGLMPSVLASKKNIVEALHKGKRFLMETDYMDDLRRPGAVLGPKTVPKLIKNLLMENIITEKQIHMIHVENPQKTYAIDLEQ